MDRCIKCNQRIDGYNTVEICDKCSKEEISQMTKETKDSLLNYLLGIKTDAHENKNG